MRGLCVWRNGPHAINTVLNTSLRWTCSPSRHEAKKQFPTKISVASPDTIDCGAMPSAITSPKLPTVYTANPK